MLTSVAGQLSRLSPTYIRLDHIYDFYDVVSRDPAGKVVYDWRKFDSELLIIKNMGAKPFLSLSYMPSALSGGSEIDLPVSWEEWKDLVKETIEHVSGNEELAISDVYYEVWNEPDLFGNFRMKGVKSYPTLYRFAALGALAAKDTLPFKIGGPATTSLYKSWFVDFLDFVGKNNLRLDFYSWHKYSPKIADFEEDVLRAKEWLVNYPEFSDLELIISESGFTSEVDEGYDSYFSAIHTIAVSTALYGNVSKVFLFEIKDGPGAQKYWGRWGILTHEKFGIPEAKPRFAAVEFLNEARGNRYLTLGQGSFVKAFASEAGGVVRTLIVNYDPFAKHIENVPLTFVNIPYREFIFKRRDFLGGIKEDRVSIEGAEFTTRVLMPPNSASIFEIAPI